jgi:hypothetical protein
MVKTRHGDASAMPQTGGDGVIRLILIAEAVGIVGPEQGYIRSGNLTIKPLRFGICTFGNVWALIMSLSAISLFCARM